MIRVSCGHYAEKEDSINNAGRVVYGLWFYRNSPLFVLLYDGIVAVIRKNRGMNCESCGKKEHNNVL